MVFLQPVRSDLRVHWRRLMLVGFLQLLAAEFALFCAALGPAPGLAGVLGAVLLCVGALSTRAVLCPMRWHGATAQNGVALAFAVAGMCLIFGPPDWQHGLAFALALVLLGGGFHRFTGAWAQRGLHWRWRALYAAASLILGVQLLLGAPGIGTVQLVTVLAIEISLGAVTWLGDAWLGWRNHQHDTLLPHLNRSTRTPGY